MYRMNKDKKWFLETVRTPSDIYPVTIIKDRYNGIYSKFSYTAFYANLHWLVSEYEGYCGDDASCREWWINARREQYIINGSFIGGGGSPNIALKDLFNRMYDFYSANG